MMDSLDRALSLFLPCAPEYGPHDFSNHGPMAAEALAALGREDAIMPWAERYAARFSRQREPRASIDLSDWSAALGIRERNADWCVFFEREIALEGHSPVLRRWVPRLAPAVGSAAFHGLLRTAHATRALDRDVTQVRQRELARGLAYWASSYLSLGGELGDADLHAASPRLPSQVLAEVPCVDVPRCDSISERLALAATQVGPSRLLSLAVPGEDLSAFVADLARTMAAVYAANIAHGTRDDIAFVHGVTGASALRLLLPHLDRAGAELLLRHGFQVAATLHATYGEVEIARVEPHPPTDLTPAIEAALAAGPAADEHAIKWIEACTREQRETGQGYGPVVAQVVARLSRG